MDDKKTNMTFDDAEKDFKKKVFDIFSEKPLEFTESRMD